jgi:hypothetical protein
MTIVVGSPYLLRCETGEDGLALATQLRILYRKPDLTEGYWPATLIGSVLTVIVSGANNSQHGEWRFHPSFLLSGYVEPFIGDVGHLTVKPKFY